MVAFQIIFRIILANLCILGLCYTNSNCNTLLVPSQYPTLQEGIDASQNGDTVLIADGIYAGIGNKNVDYSGRAIVVKSENGPLYCTIDCEYDGRGFWFHTNEDTNSVLEGIKIINGDAVPNYGGGIKIGYSSPLIKNCIVTDCQARVGGGISCGSSAAVFRDCEIKGNAAEVEGGGLSIGAAPGPVLSHCRIQNNTSVWNGAGINYGNQCHGTIQYCVITGNISDFGIGGGIYIYNGCYPDILYCTIAANSAYSGGGIYNDNSTPSLNGCIVRENRIFDNPIGGLSATYSNIIGGWSGNGNLDEDPLFVQSQQGDYRLQWESPCIDSGDPDPQYNDPDGTRADMGCFYYDQSIPIRIVMTPYDQPIEIPEEGGSFTYSIHLTNIDSNPITTTVWCDVVLPNGLTFGPVLGPVEVVIPSDVTIIRERNQTVPASAPQGLYSYMIFAVADGDTSADSFAFEKLGVALTGCTGWGNNGDMLEGVSSGGSESTPLQLEFIFSNAYPNPFNPTTALSYKLQDASKVNLSVYDISGSLVAELVNGSRDAGVHEVTFDASDLTSGVYIYRLTAADFTAIGKMILVK
jgi:hypothetical protein